MTSVMLKNAIATEFLSELQTKVKFDKLNGVEKNTPEPASPGIIESNHSKLAETTCKQETSNTSSLQDSTNLRKHVGVSMPTDFASEGFIKFPRSLFNDPHWKGMRSKYQKVFITLLFHTSYTQKSYSIGANVITIGPGQFCTSIRALIDLCNDGVKFKEDKVDKNIVERSVSLFVKIGFVRQEVRHKKSIFTISYPEIYEHFQSQSETSSETKPRHNRDINEERKERKDIKETIDGAGALDSSLLNNEKKEEQKSPSVFQPQVNNQQVQALTPEKQAKLPDLWKYAIQKKVAEGYTHLPKPGVKEQDLINWLKVYEIQDIAKAISMTEGKNILKTYGAYITRLLKDKIPKKEDDAKSGKAFVLEFAKKHSMKHLEFKQDYFTDLINNHEQTSYFLPENTLKAILERSVQRAQEHEEQERREREYEDNY
jgi:hypothetical protein